MSISMLRVISAALCAAVLVCAAAPQASAQANNDQKKTDTKPATPAPDPAKERQKAIDEITEAGRTLTGASANPECVWLGRRVVSLLWRDDLDTAFRHLDLYDRFGCPGTHVQATFRCLIKQGNIDPKQQESLNGRVHACWINPTQPAAAEASAPASSATSDGTTSR